MKSTTTRHYEHANGYSSSKFDFRADTLDGKISDFHISTEGNFSTDTMRLLAKDLQMFAERIDSTENPVYSRPVDTAAPPQGAHDDKA